MIRKREVFDPEVAALVTEVRALVGQAYQLSQEIQLTMADLGDYVEQVQPRTNRDADV